MIKHIKERVELARELDTALLVLLGLHKKALTAGEVLKEIDYLTGRYCRIRRGFNHAV